MNEKFGKIISVLYDIILYNMIDIYNKDISIDSQIMQLTSGDTNKPKNKNDRITELLIGKETSLINKLKRKNKK
jgi:hypothetical protein